VCGFTRNEQVYLVAPDWTIFRIQEKISNHPENLLNAFGDPNMPRLPSAMYHFIGGSNGVIASNG
jgi:hypothetical protein